MLKVIIHMHMANINNSNTFSDCHHHLHNTSNYHHLVIALMIHLIITLIMAPLVITLVITLLVITLAVHQPIT